MTGARRRITGDGRERCRRSRRAQEPRSIPRDSGTSAQSRPSLESGDDGRRPRRASARRACAGTQPRSDVTVRRRARARRHQPADSLSARASQRAAVGRSQRSCRLPDSRAQELKMPPGSRQRSVYVVTLPYANLPASTLVLETSGRVFQRTVRIGVERPPDRQRRERVFRHQGGRDLAPCRRADARPAAHAAARDDGGDGARAGRR